MCLGEVARSCPTLRDPMDYSLPGSPVPGILQARTLKWVAISFSNAWKWKVKVKVTQSCPTLCNPMACSLPGSFVHGILQARILEWSSLQNTGVPSSRRSSQPRDQTQVSHIAGRFFITEPLGKPHIIHRVLIIPINRYLVSIYQMMLIFWC